MRKMKIKKLTKLLVAFLITGCASMSMHSDDEIVYVDLVERLTDLKSLAELPAEGEGSAMWSSYDRKSKVGDSGSFIEWSANNDGLSPQYIRKEGENMVLAEMTGPGAIVRIWSANPQKGKVKIYIDGKEVPAVDLPFRDYFNTESINAFHYPQLVYETAARGFNNYIPIPYQKSCKIVAEPGWGQYYHFNYITFPEGTKVEAFRADPTTEGAAALSAVNSYFANDLGELPYTVDNGEERNWNLKIEAGDSETIKLRGSKAIYAFKARLRGISEENLAEALRKVVLQITWDDESTPAVWSPVGDFFGSAPGYNLYKTLPMGMITDHMYSYWYMPFEKSAVITLTNNFSRDVAIDLTIGLEKIKDEKHELARFHAKWHRNWSPPEDTARWPDWTVLKTAGRGRFLGMSLMVWNPKGGHCKQYGGAGQHWWGEGDEKFFVDGENFPSTFGTGTEDYFGYAWCVPNYFTHPFHSQSHTDDNMGYQSVNRWQVIDNVPFQESFEGYLEKYFPDHWPTQYAVTTYWYLNKGGKDPIMPAPVDQLYGFETPYEVYREVGVIEGEDFKILENTGGWATTDAFVHEQMYDEVSGHKTLMWHGKPEAENELTASFNVDRSGDYKITAQLTKSPQGGKFKVFLNGKEITRELNLKADVKPGQAEKIELGTFKLKAGKQIFRFEWLPEEGFGRKLMLDFIDLEPI